MKRVADSAVAGFGRQRRRPVPGRAAQAGHASTRAVTALASPETRQPGVRTGGRRVQCRRRPERRRDARSSDGPRDPPRVRPSAGGVRRRAFTAEVGSRCAVGAAGRRAADSGSRPRPLRRRRLITTG
ncbi:MAG: hypothetical protein MZW92_52760 [Comamonadaceae bacterium]|nr:hypothetical protein [Comamonadaceae bacterium]